MYQIGPRKIEWFDIIVLRDLVVFRQGLLLLNSMENNFGYLVVRLSCPGVLMGIVDSVKSSGLGCEHVRDGGRSDTVP